MPVGCPDLDADSPVPLWRHTLAEWGREWDAELAAVLSLDELHALDRAAEVHVLANGFTPTLPLSTTVCAAEDLAGELLSAWRALNDRDTHARRARREPLADRRPRSRDTCPRIGGGR